MNFEMVEIDSIEEVEFDGKVYDFEVEDDHSYNVDGILVHNSDFVMLGGMFAGHDESGGIMLTERVIDGYSWENGQYIPIFKEKLYKEFYGMSSDTAQKKYYGEQKDYRASEGRTVKVPYRGVLENTVREILGGVRSACTYVGAENIKALPKCTTFIRVNNTHNRVYIDKEI
ncbi:MAG: IMP dehydrogenase [bacterium]